MNELRTSLGNLARALVGAFRLRIRTLATGDDGMSTAEYAVGTIAAAALAAVLYTIVTGDSVVSGLTALVQRALTVSF